MIGSDWMPTACSPLRRGPRQTSASRSCRSAAISSDEDTPTVVSTSGVRVVNASISGGATNSATVLVAATRSRCGAPWAERIAASASAARLIICEAIPTRRCPPPESAMPCELGVISGSPRCLRNAASAPDTAGSLTPSARAAAFTEPSRATSTKASSWVSVTHHS